MKMSRRALLCVVVAAFVACFVAGQAAAQQDLSDAALSAELTSFDSLVESQKQLAAETHNSFLEVDVEAEAEASPDTSLVEADAEAEADSERRRHRRRHRGRNFRVSPNGATNRYITDWGYGHRERIWADVRGVGQRNDYGRWVGDRPNIWFAVAVFGCPNQYTGKNVFNLHRGQIVRGPAFNPSVLTCGRRAAPAPPRRAAPPPARRPAHHHHKHHKPRRNIRRSPSGAINKSIHDWGYTNREQIWDDVRGVGVKNDYGRWVGNAPHIWFSVAIFGCPFEHTDPKAFLPSGGRIVRGPAFTPAFLKCQRSSPSGAINKVIRDYGYMNRERIWDDVRGVGVKNDYGRWVGNAPHIWFSVAIFGCPFEHTDPHMFRPQGGRIVRDRAFFPSILKCERRSPSGALNKYITDWGYMHRERIWADVRGVGVKNDYGRWVGNAPHIWFSVAVFNCPNQYTGRGVFKLRHGKIVRGPKFVRSVIECGQHKAHKQHTNKHGVVVRPNPAALAAARARPSFNPKSRHSSGDITVSPTGKKNRHITDWGYAHDRQWVDVRGAGKRLDYGRWVGNAPHIWFSIALWDCPHQYSGRGEWVLKGGRVERGPNYKGHGCGTPAPAKRVWTPPPGAKWQAKPIEQKHYPDIKHARGRAAVKGVAKLSCPKGQHIMLKDATFGAGAGVWQQSGFINKGVCHLAASLSKAASKCQNQATCELRPSEDEFGSDPCPSNANKEVLVTYSCVTFTAPSTVHPPAAIQSPHPGIKLALVDDLKTALLTCPGDNVINVLDASYGSGQGFYAANGFMAKGKCHAPSSPRVVADLCHGKGNCNFLVSSEKFPVTCEGKLPRKLKVTYRCDKTAVKFVARKSKPPPRVWKYVKPEPIKLVPQPAVRKAAAAAAPPAPSAPKKAAVISSATVGDDGVVRIGDSEVHIHVTQLSAPEPNAQALNYVEEKLEKLHETAMNKIEKILDDLEAHRVQKKPCLKKLQRTIDHFKHAFVAEANQVNKITHKFSYADDAKTLV